MAPDPTVVLVNRPGSDAAAMEALGRAGINIDGVTGSGCTGEGILHVLVADAGSARRALEAVGQVAREEREVLVLPVDDRPGEGGAIMRRIADAGVNVDFIYLGRVSRAANAPDRALVRHDASEHDSTALGPRHLSASPGRPPPRLPRSVAA